MNNNIKVFRGFLSSSSDSTGQTLSLTVASAGKTIIGLLGSLFAVWKFTPDPTAVTTYVQLLVDATVMIIPIGFTAWHTMQTVWGATRKLISSWGTEDIPVAVDLPVKVSVELPPVETPPTI